jgi:hypothetical protein
MVTAKKSSPETPKAKVPGRDGRGAPKGPSPRPARDAPRTRPIPTVDNFRDDPLYPRVARAVAELLALGKVVAPVDVLVHMHLLTRAQLEDWRFGRVPYLERVILGNLTRLGRMLRILRMHAHDLNLVPSMTVYKRYGKGPKQTLRFSKTGEPRVEEAYARHFVWPGKGPFHPPDRKGHVEDGRAAVDLEEVDEVASEDERGASEQRARPESQPQKRSPIGWLAAEPELADAILRSGTEGRAGDKMRTLGDEDPR